MNITKKETRRSVQNRNRSANKFGLKPFAPTLSLREIADINRLRDHVAQSLDSLLTFDSGDAEDIASGYDWSPIDFAEELDGQYAAFEQQDAVDTILALEEETTDHPRPYITIIDSIRDELANMPPPNGYDYRRDVLPDFAHRSTKPTGSNAWPWNRKLACCALNEKNCQCGEWRRYF